MSQPKNKKHNTSWTVRIRDPLVRPGIEIEAGPVSEDYLVPTVRKGLDKIRQINKLEQSSD